MQIDPDPFVASVDQLAADEEMYQETPGTVRTESVVHIFAHEDVADEADTLPVEEQRKHRRAKARQKLQTTVEPVAAHAVATQKAADELKAAQEPASSAAAEEASRATAAMEAESERNRGAGPQPHEEPDARRSRTAAGKLHPAAMRGHHPAI